MFKRKLWTCAANLKPLVSALSRELPLLFDLRISIWLIIVHTKTSSSTATQFISHQSFFFLFALCLIHFVSFLAVVSESSNSLWVIPLRTHKLLWVVTSSAIFCKCTLLTASPFVPYITHNFYSPFPGHWSLSLQLKTFLSTMTH